MPLNWWHIDAQASLVSLLLQTNLNFLQLLYACNVFQMVMYFHSVLVEDCRSHCLIQPESFETTEALQAISHTQVFPVLLHPFWNYHFMVICARSLFSRCLPRSLVTCSYPPVLTAFLETAQLKSWGWPEDDSMGCKAFCAWFKT